MKLVAQNNNIVCKQINESKSTIGKEFVFQEENLPIYQILSIGSNLNDFRFKVGDNVICNSNGMQVNVNDNLIYLFKEENIVGKV